MKIDEPAAWSMYEQGKDQYPFVWHGTLLQDKKDREVGVTYQRNRYYDRASGRFTQEDPIGLAGGLNAYGFANGDPVNFGDPFGICPPLNTNVSDCPNDNLGNTWRALDAAGSAGRAVIAGIVGSHLSVSARAFTDNDDCGRHSCYVRGAITVNEADDPGTLSVALGHEYAHSTETTARDKWDVADNELRAWDESRGIFDALGAPYRRQAETSFAADFNALQTPGGRRVNRRVFACRAEAKMKGESVAKCIP